MTTDSTTSSSLWQTVPLAGGDSRPHRGRPDMSDIVFFLALAASAGWTLAHHGSAMDYYEKLILCAGVPVLTWLGWLWRPMRVLLVACGLAAGLAVALYGHDLSRAEHDLLLKYLLSSQSAILWMSALFILATVCYWLGFFSPTCAWLGTACTWGAVFAGLTGMLVRWRESHLMGPGLGHIPVSNLYEVFVLFSLITALFYLYYERRYATRALGGFVLLVISAAVGFLLWYALTRDAWQIQPLVPALQSWWMKLHVPANFIGYGSFSLSAMVACAYLVKQHFPGGRLARALPAPQVLDDLMYRSIAVGFAFFTVATVLGALWAADAWGTYWQWDPKETWALIVWLNYAAWLHMRLMKGLRGSMAAWWALVGLLVTTFAFLGVNMFLSGLHSYGEL
ncbi:MAG: c-type cytochrome biogenesis protein CcsB [Bordetella sp.]|uniref:c-type cytochrome biogenesis protein CcsB n=1 Tax=Bordetella sp. TaxID=28081 RepID=UPI003F7BBBD8